MLSERDFRKNVARESSERELRKVANGNNFLVAETFFSKQRLIFCGWHSVGGGGVCFHALLTDLSHLIVCIIVSAVP